MITPKKDSKGRYFIRFWIEDGRRPYKNFGVIPYDEAKAKALAFYNSFQTVPTDTDIKPSLSMAVYALLEMSTKIKPANEKRIRFYLTEKFIPFFSDRAMEDLSFSDVERYMKFRMKQKGYKGETTQGATINREVATLAAIIKECLHQNIIKRHPWGGKTITRLKVNKRLGNYFEATEWDRFLASFKDSAAILEAVKRNGRVTYCKADRDAFLENAGRMVDLFQTQLLTCSLVGEILTLRFGPGMVNMETGKIKIFQSKTGNPKEQNITGDLKGILQRLYDASPDKNGYVFTRADGKPFPIGQVESFFKLGMKLAGVQKPLTPHSIRHTACSWMVQQNASVAKIQAIAGHKEIKSTMAYAAVNVDSLNDALSLLTNREKMDNGGQSEITLKIVK